MVAVDGVIVLSRVIFHKLYKQEKPNLETIWKSGFSNLMKRIFHTITPTFRPRLRPTARA